MASRIVVADAGPLIAFAVGGVLPQSAVMLGGILVPQAVMHECCNDAFAPGAAVIALARSNGSLEVVADISIHGFERDAVQGLGSGEIAVLAYARQEHLLSLIDDRRARRAAARLGLPVIGSGTVIAQLKLAGHIASVGPVLALWRQHRYFVSDALQQEVLRLSGEA